MDERNQPYYDNSFESQNEATEKANFKNESIDINQIADAYASASNGPNGAEVNKTIRHLIYVVGAAFGLKTICDSIYRLKCEPKAI